MKTVKHHALPFPFADNVTYMFIGSQESADTLGFPEGGHWYREGDLWELRGPLVANTPYEYDDSQCAECQGWGAPTGCRTCGTHCMGG